MTDTRELVERLRGTSEGAYLTGSNGDVKARHLREAADTIERLQRGLLECVELLTASAEEMEESCATEGRLTSMKVCAERIRALLARLKESGT